MTQTNQTYIKEKKQEIEKAILEYLDDNGWKYGEDFYGWLIPSITQALQDAIKYGEGIGREERDKEIARHLENTVMQHVTPEMEDKKLAIKMLKNIIDILKRAKLTTSPPIKSGSQEEG